MIELNNLTPRQTYYYRDFAQNKVGKANGDMKMFNVGFGNPNNAFINFKGCLICDDFALRYSFAINRVTF